MDSFNGDGTTFDRLDGAPRSGSSRKRDRDSMFLMARIQVGEAPWRDVRVRNLSAGGLMAEMVQPVAIGTTVTIDLRGIGEVPGRVAWHAEGRAGIAFDVPVDPIKARKPIGQGATTPVYAKPVVATRRR